MGALLAVATAVGAAAAGPACAGDPILPLSQVHPGMVGTAYTVVSGTQIVSFPVTVLDVSRSGEGPGSSLIIIRAEGPLMEQTGGIAQGMSGSPVYVTGTDGVARVIGAIAYGQGDERNVLGGITPIEQMLANASGPRQLDRVRRPPARPVIVARDAATAATLRRRRPGARVMAPLTRWTVSGLNPRLVGGLRRALGPGVQVDASGPVSPKPPVTLVPGASMAAQIIAGPVSLGAIGTVTYVDGPTVLGFGHPFLNAGPEQLLLADAHITTVVASPIRNESYKLGTAGTTQGTIVGDRRDGVVARLGTPRAVSVVSDARDTRRGATSHMESQVAPQPELLPLVVDLLQLEPVVRVRDGTGVGTLTVSYTIESPGLPTIRYRNVYAAQGDVAGLSGGRLGAIVSTLTDNPVGVVVPTRVTIRQTLRPEVRAGIIVSAGIATRFVRPGRNAHLVLRVRMWRGGITRVVVPFRVPRTVARGVTRMRVVPYDASGFDSSQADLTAALEGDAATSRVRARAQTPRAAATGTRAQRIMGMVRRSTDDRHDAVRLLMPGENADAGVGVQAGTHGIVISGGRATVTLRVR